jgi:hypothetical protein
MPAPIDAATMASGIAAMSSSLRSAEFIVARANNKLKAVCLLSLETTKACHQMTSFCRFMTSEHPASVYRLRQAWVVGASMEEVIVMCSECGVQAKVLLREDQISDSQGICRHRQNPLNCPNLRFVLSVGRQELIERLSR